MTIEITNGKSSVMFRINPYAPTEIDRRSTRKNGRWKFYSRHATPEKARAVLLELEEAVRGNDADEALRVIGASE